MPSPKPNAGLNPLQRILSNAGWLTGSQLGGDIANLMLFVVLARAFGPEGIGRYAYALGIAAIIYAIVNLGLEDLAVRECARTRRSARGELMSRLLLLQSGALGASAVLLACYFYAVPHSVEAIGLILVLGAQQVFFAFSRTLLSPAYAEQRMAAAAVVQFLARIIGILIALYLVLVGGWNLTASVLPLAIGGFLLFVYSVKSCLDECSGFSIKADWPAMRQALVSAWPFAASLALSLMAIRSSFILVNVMLGDAETGVYASAMKLMEVAVLPLGFLGTAAYPRLSRLYYESKVEFDNASEILVRVAAVVGLLVSWGMIYVAPHIIVPLLGERFAETAPMVQVLAGLAFLTSLSFMLVRLLLASDRHHLRLGIQTTMVAVLFVSTVVTVPLYGLDGAIFGMYASVATSVLLTFAVIGPQVRAKMKIPALKLSGSVLAACVAAASAWSFAPSVVLSGAMSLVVFTVLVFAVGLVPQHAMSIFFRSGNQNNRAA